MKNLKKYLKIHYVILAFIILTAIFLRLYNHEKLLNFQLDQSRDAIIVSNFVDQGFEKIPLLGPQARGSELMLGPVFYYFQSIAVFFFGNRPDVLAFPDLLFSVLLIPLLYVFLRLYFSKNICLIITALGATSLFLIIYGRFAWNPNSLPFFTLLTAYGLLKSNRFKSIEPPWLYLAAASTAVASQLHFVYFLATPFIIISYFIFWKPKFKLKHYLIATLTIAIIYIPVIISETRSGGANSKAFVQTIIGKKEKDKHNIVEDVFRAYQETQKMNWEIITSEKGNNVIPTRGFNITCNKECRQKIPLLILQFLFFGSGIVASIFIYKKEKDENRRKFVFLIWIWTSSLFLVFTLIAYQLSLRFYLPLVVPFLTLFGFTLEKLGNFSGKKGSSVVILIGLFFVFLNLRSSLIYLKEHDSMFSKIVSNPKGNYFFNDEKITLEQLQATTDYIKEIQPSESPIRIIADNKYARSIYYLLNYRDDISACYVKWSSFHPTGTKSCFLILQADWEKELPSELDNLFSVEKRKKIGNLDIFYLKTKKIDLKSEEDYCWAE